MANDDPIAPSEIPVGDPGPPLGELAALREPVPPEFVDKVRRRIHRRALMLHVTELGWSGPLLVFLEFLSTILGSFGRRGARERDGQHE